MSELKLGFKVTTELMAEADVERKQKIYDVARMLVRSLLFSWKPGDGVPEFSVSFECGDAGHNHEPAQLTVGT